MNSKKFIVGLVAGAALGTTVTAIGSNPHAQNVYVLTDHSITIDGKNVEIPNDFSILNYKDRVYTSARVIAEGMGATVGYNVDNKVVEITIPTPQPTPETTSAPEPTATPEPTTTPMSDDTYVKYPVKMAKDETTINLYGMYVASSGEVRFSFDVKNDADWGVQLQGKDAYLLVKDKKYYLDSYSKTHWLINSINPNGFLEFQPLVFMGDDAIADANKVTLCLPFKQFKSLVNAGDDTLLEFNLNIDFSDQGK